MEKTSKKQSIAEASIEDLVNSSLDLAAESVNAKVTAPVQIEELDELDDIETQEDLNIESVTEIEESSDLITKSDKTLMTHSQKQNQASNSDADLEVDNNIIDEPEITEPFNISDVTTKASELESTQDEPLSPNTSIESLEIEAAELESEILIEMDKLVAKADHLKDNIQSELKRVSTENEQLQQEVDTLKEKLSVAEDKIQSLSDDQSRQQATLRKIIMILKGVNAKISHL